MSKDVSGVALQLLISPEAPASAAAVAFVSRLLARYDDRAFRFEVRDLSKAPLGADEAPVIILPLLIIDGPAPVRIFGQIDDVAPIERALAAAGVRRLADLPS